jgi:hypothetical protein
MISNMRQVTSVVNKHHDSPFQVILKYPSDVSSTRGCGAGFQRDGKKASWPQARLA